MTDSDLSEALAGIPPSSQFTEDPEFPGLPSWRMRCRVCRVDPSWENPHLGLAALARVPREDWSKVIRIYWDSPSKHDETLVFPVGTEAKIVLIMMVKASGRAHLVRTPKESHVEVLRSLGFETMQYPNGRRYKIRKGWPGVRRLRSSSDVNEFSAQLDMRRR